MRVIFAGNESRGLPCLRRILKDGHSIACVVIGPSHSDKFVREVSELGLPVERSQNVNDPEVVARMRALEADVTVLAGFSQIVKQPILDVTRFGAINLHAGKLPEMRGSSPLNWALILGKREATFSVIQVDTGVDTGPVLAERTVPVTASTTIAELHDLANAYFPELVGDVLRNLEMGTLRPRIQSDEGAAYFPLRFPEDGLIVWDLMDQEQIGNTVRALSKPYPGAFGIIHGRKLSIQKTEIPKIPLNGEPGRIYRIEPRGILVGTRTEGLWITEAHFQGAESLDFKASLKRYDSFLTVRQLMLRSLL